MVSNGILRSSMRLTEKASWDTAGLPWHPCRERDACEPDFRYGPVHLEIDLLPVSYVFEKGHRIRVAVTASLFKFQSYQENPVPVVELFRDTLYPSRLTLPVEKGDDER